MKKLLGGVTNSFSSSLKAKNGSKAAPLDINELINLNDEPKNTRLIWLKNIY